MQSARISGQPAAILPPRFVPNKRKRHDMNTHVITTLSLAIVVAIMTSCQSQPKTGGQDAATAAKDTVANQNMKPTESGYADVNGLKMYYEVYGQGKPLVLLHGSFMNIPMNWSHIIPVLAKDRKVIVTEMQGHGRTRDIPREVSYEGMADDVSGLLKHLKIESADVLGYSMGGGIAFQVAVRHPEQVRRLVVLSGAYKHDGWWPDVEASFGTFTADMFNGTPIRQQYDSFGNDPAHFQEFVKKVISIDLKPYDWSKDVKNIAAPIFMAIGDADGVRYEHALELFRAKGGGKMGDLHGLPKSRLAILPGTTHIGMTKRTDWLLPMVTDFLDSDLNAAPPTF
jgi:pimeloyl-ACP methyl ester carboxylesterase